MYDPPVTTTREEHMEPTPTHGESEIRVERARGIWAPALTPLADKRHIDAGRFTAHAGRLLADSCHGIVIFGTTGEAPSFAVTERRGLLEAALESGLPPERLMVGTGCCALPDTVDLTAHAARTGCKRVLVLPPFYFKDVSEEGLYAGYAELIERLGDPGLRLYLYHFPRLSGVPISTRLVERLIARYPGVVAGVKDSSGDWANTAELLARFPDLDIFVGSERFLLQALRAGGAGCITASANVHAGPLRAAYDAWRAGSADAPARQAHVSALRRVLEEWPMIAALKAMVAQQRDDPGWAAVRPPLVAFEPAQEETLRAQLESAGLASAANPEA